MNTNTNIAEYIDHTLLKSDSNLDDVRTLCNEAVIHKFYAVCVNSCHTRFTKGLLEGQSPKLAVTVGFPLGATHSQAKAAEAYQAVLDGADELDMVLNIGLLKSGKHAEVEADMKCVFDAAQNASAALAQSKGESKYKHIVVKVIFENCLLTDAEKRTACTLSINAGLDFIKTSTGFTTGTKSASGATKEDLALMLDTVKGTSLKVKAAGGIKTRQTALDYIAMGVSRIGTSSGIALLQGNDSKGY